MIKWTEELLIKDGYTIENAKVDSIDLSMADHGCLTLSMTLKGRGWGCVYGGYALGHGYVGADDDFFDGSASGMEYIIRIMAVADCHRFNDLVGKYIRVAVKNGDPIRIIGNIIKDNWFDAKSFFTDKESEG